MRRWVWIVLYGVAGVAFAVGLTLFAYAVAGGGAAEPAVPIGLSGDLAPPAADPSPSPRPTATGGEDISGPCDEAEHADDPRCLDGEDDDDRDRSGSNSGKGSD